MNLIPQSSRGRWLIAGIAFVIFLVWNSQRHATNLPASGSSSAVEASPPKEKQITMADYDGLQTGMSYDDVAVRLGSEGTEISSNEIGGTKTIMYQWKAGGMGNMNAMFQDGKMISKAQFGLR